MAQPNDRKRLTIPGKDDVIAARLKMWAEWREDCTMMMWANTEALLEGYAQALNEQDDD